MSAICTIGGVVYTMIEDQHDLTNSVNERQRFKCDIIDYTGLAHFVKGEQITITDPGLGMVFNGFINSDKETPQYPSGAILHEIDCIDQHYLADKRTYTQTYETPTLAGKIAVDMLSNVLLAEGITQNFAVQDATTMTDWNTGTNTGTMGALNVGDGNLELLTAGSTVTIVEGTTAQFATGTLTNMQATANLLVPTTTNALRLQSTLSFAYGIEFAQSLIGVTGTASGNVSGTASGTVSGNPSGTASGSISVSGGLTPSGTVSISGGAPGESASFSGFFAGITSTGSAFLSTSESFSTSANLGFSTSATFPMTTSVTGQPYQPKTKSKAKIVDTHYHVVTVKKAVADNRTDAIIWTGSQVIGSNDTLFYDIWIASTSPSEEGGVDLYFSDGTTLTQYLGTLQNNFDVGVWDQNLLSVSPIQDLSNDAKDAWYTRQINLSALSGKTVTSVSVFNAANIAGTFDIYVKNCYLGSHSGSPFFGPSQTAPTLNPPVTTSIGAYIDAATIVTVVAVYNPTISSRVSPAYNIDPVKLVKNSNITWISSLPAAGPAFVTGSQGFPTVPGISNVFVSYDATTWLPCVNNQALPGLPTGANVAGMSLYLLETFSGGQDPSALPALVNVTITINSAPKATTTDITSVYGTTSAWNTGVEFGAAPNSSGDLALGMTSYNWPNLTGMSFTPGSDVSGHNPTQGTSGGVYTVSSPGYSGGASWSTSRFNFIAAVQDFTAEADFALNSSSEIQNEVGFLCRQTYWGSPNNSFAYYIRVMRNPGGGAGGTGVTFGYGTNNPPSNPGGGPSSGPFTPVVVTNQTINNGTTYHIKLVVGQNRHTVYWNHGSSPIIDVLDNTYTAPGNIGLRTYHYSTNSGSGKISNFTVTNTFAGVWTSPSINLNSLGTCGATQVSWSEVNLVGTQQATAIAMASLDGGSTWQQCTNGSVVPAAIIPGLQVGTNVVGKSLKIQLILAATSLLTSPIIQGLYVRVCGAYPGASGNRSTAPLGNDLMIRANQSGWGTAFDGQTWVKVGTGTDAIVSNEGSIANTTGDVHEVLGSRTWTDLDGTVRFQLSAATISAGIELRYTDANNFYRLQVSTTTVTILKKEVGVTTTLATVPITVTTGVWWRMRFRVFGTAQPILQGNVWLDGTLEPTIHPTTGFWDNTLWTIVTAD